MKLETIRLANNHWHYTGNLLRLCFKVFLKIAKYLYIMAFIHGVKHGKEDNVHSDKD